ncbi:MAG: SDR family oxidoreductase [Candidatus Nanopelagicales bacterium]|jgi:enoyl-[acyl-carrier protein] reductase I|nr:SDR family oxidoreductase [Candidatus Nanopelagicales bacterium]MCU0297650.1 SDR family oxidoreductase [Candidatus Nanopelagicales bacterium]
MLTGKRLLITGVVTTDSIAWAVAESAQLHNAEVILTSYDRVRDLTQAAAEALPRTPEILTLDATRPEDFAALADQLAGRQIDGALHAIAFAPREALAGDFLSAGDEAIELAFRTSTTSFARLAGVLAECAPANGASLVGLDFDADGRAWPVYNWMGVCKVALQATMRYVARDLGPRGVRANLVAAGPLHTRAAGGIPDFQSLLDAYDAAPLGWDPQDAGPVADAVCFLLSDMGRAVSAEILHVDGGYHALAAPGVSQAVRRAG